MHNVACLQSVDELLAEPLDPLRLIDEVTRTARACGDAAFCPVASQVIAELRNTALASPLAGTSAMLPGNLAYLARLRDSCFRIRLMVLECPDIDAPRSRLAIARFKTLCRAQHVELRLLQSDWRKFAGRAKIAGKLAFENAVLDALQECAIDVLLMDRAMFYVGVLIAAGSPIAPNVLNSHPGLLSGPFCNPGKTPTLNALRLKRDCGATETGVTVHRATGRVDVGQTLAERRFGLLDISTPQQLRSRLYSGIEALTQMAAMRETRFETVDWSSRKPIDVESAEQIYQTIQPPPAGPASFGLRAS